MLDMSPFLDRIFPQDPTTAALVAVCLLALAVAVLALRVVALAIQPRDRR